LLRQIPAVAMMRSKARKHSIRGREWNTPAGNGGKKRLFSSQVLMELHSFEYWGEKTIDLKRK